MRNTFISGLRHAAALCLLASGFSAAAAAQQTHVLAIAACPPWKAIEGDAEGTKRMAESCENDVETIVPALRQAFAVPETNVTTRLNVEADAAGVSKAITSLASRAKREDRVILYINLHGGSLAAKYAGYAVKDEILATYTLEEPKDFSAATSNDTWMTVREVRDLIDQIEAEEIVVVFEVCESGSSLKDFRYDLARRYEKGWHGREAVIFSSSAYQSATFNEAGTIALFTETFARNLSKTPRGNIRDIFEVSALETHRSRRNTCMKDDNLDTLFDHRSAYLEGCTQVPTVFDPYGLLDDIQVGGRTLPSRWDEIKGRKPVTDTAKTTDADPFAWAEAYVGMRNQAHTVPAGYPQMMTGPYSQYPWHR